VALLVIVLLAVFLLTPSRVAHYKLTAVVPPPRDDFWVSEEHAVELCPPSALVVRTRPPTRPGSAKATTTAASPPATYTVHRQAPRSSNPVVLLTPATQYVGVDPSLELRPYTAPGYGGDDYGTPLAPDSAAAASYDLSGRHYMVEAGDVDGELAIPRARTWSNARAVVVPTPPPPSSGYEPEAPHDNIVLLSQNPLLMSPEYSYPTYSPVARPAFKPLTHPSAPEYDEDTTL
jgi:hypothetical protein